MRILLIDDDRDDQLLFHEAVKIILPDAQCHISENGKEGLEYLERCEDLPVLVFLDINMPIMDGKETLRRIRESASLRNLAVVIYSTSNNSEEIRGYLAQGARYITKPNDFEMLVSLLKKPLVEAILEVSHEYAENNKVLNKVC